jgi:hypothetical protein
MIRLAWRDWLGTNEALGVCSRDATANRLIVDSIDHGVRQQYQFTESSQSNSMCITQLLAIIIFDTGTGR